MHPDPGHEPRWGAAASGAPASAGLVRKLPVQCARHLRVRVRRPRVHGGQRHGRGGRDTDGERLTVADRERITVADRERITVADRERERVADRSARPVADRRRDRVADASPSPSPRRRVAVADRDPVGRPRRRRRPPSPPAIATNPTLGPAASGLKLAKTQRGPAVKGSVAVARPGSRIKIALKATPAALGRKGKSAVVVGTATKTAQTGTASFTVLARRRPPSRRSTSAARSRSRSRSP